MQRGTRGTLVALLLVLAVGGCAETRMADFGPLPGDHRLVTLVVTKDRSVVERECGGVPSIGPMYGCEISRPIALSGGIRMHVVKIVRLTDAIPSEMSFEIEVHELCHAVASLQPIADPCHLENGGLLRAEVPVTPRLALPAR